MELVTFSGRNSIFVKKSSPTKLVVLKKWCLRVFQGGNSLFLDWAAWWLRRGHRPAREFSSSRDEPTLEACHVYPVSSDQVFFSSKAPEQICCDCFARFAHLRFSLDPNWFRHAAASYALCSCADDDARCAQCVHADSRCRKTKGKTYSLQNSILTHSEWVNSP